MNGSVPQVEIPWGKGPLKGEYPLLIDSVRTDTADREVQGVILPAPLGSPPGLGDCSDQGPEAIVAELRGEGDPRAKELLSRVRLADPLNFQNQDQARAVDLIKEAVRSWLDLDGFVLLLGGEHTVTLGAARALQEKGERFGVLYFDAHADLKSGVGSHRLTHATVARRLAEDGLEVIGLGWRSFDAREYEFWRRRGIRVCSCSDLARNKDKAKQVLDSLPRRVYLSLDLDVLDPAILAATGAPEPDGLSLETLRHLIGRIFGTRQVVGADVVELSPRPGESSSQSIAASLALDLLEQALEQRTPAGTGPSVIPLPLSRGRLAGAGSALDMAGEP